MWNAIRGVAAGAVLFLISGCTTFELEGDGVKSADSCHGSETVHGSLFGFRWGERDIEKCTEQHGLYRVEVHDNALFVLASVLTLGLYVPQTVEWWCDAGQEWDDEEPLFDPDREHE